jgi:hypothetical protein
MPNRPASAPGGAGRKLLGRSGLAAPETAHDLRSVPAQVVSNQPRTSVEFVETTQARPTYRAAQMLESARLGSSVFGRVRGRLFIGRALILVKLPWRGGP